MTSVPISSPASVSVSARIAQVLTAFTTDIFGVMGNGNAFFLDAAEAAGLRFTAVRHEAAAVAAADTYNRVCNRLAVATTTYGPGFTNAITSLAEASRARIPVVLVTGEAPASGARTWDVDQAAIAAAVDAPTFIATPDNAGAATAQAARHALERRTAVVLAIPYDLATSAVTEEYDAVQARSTAPYSFGRPGVEALERAALLLARAERPLLLAGRGAHVSGAAGALAVLADRLGALTAGTALARRLLPAGPRDLGIAGGFGTAEAAEIMAEADAVLVVGAGLNQFTMRFGRLFGEDATVIQVDIAEQATHPRVDVFLRGDARDMVESLAAMVPERPGSPTWPSAPAARTEASLRRAPGTGASDDGRLDPRSVAAALDGILPLDRVVVQDGGHFIGWAPMYWEVPGPYALNMVGTAFQTIGLGLASAVGAGAASPESTIVLSTGDGGLLMALADLESVVRTVRSGVVVVFNDAAYGAEIHQYGTLGVTERPMRIPDVDFAALGRALGAQGATIRTLGDLAALRDWVAAGARGVFVADCRISTTVRAPYMSEIMEVAARARELEEVGSLGATAEPRR